VSAKSGLPKATCEEILNDIDKILGTGVEIDYLTGVAIDDARSALGHENV
jgi:hypothetical protein